MATWRWSPRAKARTAMLGIAAMVAFLAFVGCDTTSAYTPTHGSQSVGQGPAVTAPGVLQPGPGDWTRFDYDAARSGQYPVSSISPTNVSGLHKLWTAVLPSVADSTQIYLHNLTLADGSLHDVLYVTSKDGRLIALDAGTGHILWSQQPAGSNITNSSPVADIHRQFVYAYGLDGYLHKYATATGAEVTSGGWPVRITLMPGSEKESSAINFANGYIYVTTSGYYGDAPPYQGHIVTINVSTGNTHVFNSLCSNITHLLGPTDCPDEQSGIWARGGVVVDPVTHDIFATTGNGPYTANTGGFDWGDTILKLSPDGSQLLDSYTPSNYSQLNFQDADLGSAAPGMLPYIPTSKTPYLLVQGGKDFVLRLVNRQNLSGMGGPGHVGGELQTISTPGGNGCEILTQPAVWTDPATGQVWVFVADGCKLGAFKVVTDNTGVTQLQASWTLSLNGTSPLVVNGVLYIATSGTLWALNPISGATEWSSTQSGAGGSIGGIHWESPIVVDAKVYCSDENGNLTAYGL